MEITSYASELIEQSLVPKYTKDFVGGVQLLEKSGFFPFQEKEPLNSALNQVFDKFIKKTGLNLNKDELKAEFLEKNPDVKRALNLYNALETTFSPKITGKDAKIVDFLNSKIEEYVSTYDKNSNGYLTKKEAGDLDISSLNKNNDNMVDVEEIKSDFYNNFKELKNIINYFKNSPGSFVDIYA